MDGGDLYVRAALALILVLALIALTAAILHRLGPARVGRKPGRLGIVENLAIDAKRRLILIRRDGVEHLILTGGPADLMVEASISPVEAAAEGTTATIAAAARVPPRFVQGQG